MSTLAQLRERMTERLRELDTLNRTETRSDEQEQRIDALLAEINDLGPQIERQAAIDAAGQQLRAYSEPGRNLAQVVPTEGTRGLGEVRNESGALDMRSPARRFMESAEFRAARANPRGVSDPVEVGTLLGRREAILRHIDGMGPDQLRTLVSSSTSAADMLLPTYVAGIFRGREKPLVVRDVLISGQTNSDAITFFEESVFTNAAAEFPEVVSGAKPESALAFAQRTASVQWIGHWIPITRQTLQDQPQMETYINGRLLDGLARREDNQLLNGDGTGSNLRGLRNTTGVQVLNDAYFATVGNEVVDAGTSREGPNRIRRAKTKIMTAGDALATFILANPADVEKWDTLTDENGNYLLGGPDSGNSVRTLWGLPIVESQNQPAGEAIVGDGTMAAVFDRMQAQLYTTDSHADYFVQNKLVILAEERLALAVFRPVAFAKVELPD